MPTERGFTLSAASVDRLRRLLPLVESTIARQTADEGPSQPTIGGRAIQLVQVTSATATTDGRYQGKVLRFNNFDESTTQLATCAVIDLNGGSLSTGKYFAVRAGLVQDNDIDSSFHSPLFIAVASASGSSTTFIGLSDTPSAWGASAADAHKLVKVEAAGTSLEFFDHDGSTRVTYSTADPTGDFLLIWDATGLEWKTLLLDNLTPCTTFGDLAVHDAVQMARLAAGSDGQLLMPLFSTSPGLRWRWIDDLTSDGSPDGVADYVMTYDASAGSHKKVLLDNLPSSGRGSSPLGGKGDLYAHDGSADAALAVGTNNQLLFAANGESTGLLWDWIGQLTEDTDPDLSSDFLLSYDDSATDHKKLKLQTIVDAVLIETQTFGGIFPPSTSPLALIRPVNVYEFRIHNLTTNQSTGPDWEIQVQTAGSVWQTGSAYHYQIEHHASTGGSTFYNSASANQMIFHHNGYGINNSSTLSCINGIVRIFIPANATRATLMQSFTQSINGTTVHGSGTWRRRVRLGDRSYRDSIQGIGRDHQWSDLTLWDQGVEREAGSRSLRCHH